MLIALLAVLVVDRIVVIAFAAFVRAIEAGLIESSMLTPRANVIQKI